MKTPKQEPPMSTTVQNIVAMLKENIGQDDGAVPRPDKSNTGKILFDIFVWQELARIAEIELGHAWKRAETNGIIAEDDKLRAQITGEKEVATSKSFSLVVNVKSASKRLAVKNFIAQIVKEFRLKLADVEAIAEENTTSAKSPLQKRVVERV